MPQYIIKWNYGFGDNYDEVEADNLEDAKLIAYDQWEQDAQQEADYCVVDNKEATDEMREDYLE